VDSTGRLQSYPSSCPPGDQSVRGGIAWLAVRCWVTDYLNRNPDAVVLHLWCGLQSRAFRLAVPEGVRWFDVDLPQIITCICKDNKAFVVSSEHSDVD
jgi:Leucine carboxyl methyltransferase